MDYRFLTQNQIFLQCIYEGIKGIRKYYLRNEFKDDFDTILPMVKYLHHQWRLFIIDKREIDENMVEYVEITLHTKNLLMEFLHFHLNIKIPSIIAY